MKVTTLDGGGMELVFVRLSQQDITKLQNELDRTVRTGTVLAKYTTGHGNKRVIVSVEGP